MSVGEGRAAKVIGPEAGKLLSADARARRAKLIHIAKNAAMSISRGECISPEQASPSKTPQSAKFGEWDTA